MEMGAPLVGAPIFASRTWSCLDEWLFQIVAITPRLDMARND
jgi:hypothetical protein